MRPPERVSQQEQSCRARVGDRELVGGRFRLSWFAKYRVTSILYMVIKRPVSVSLLLGQGEHKELVARGLGAVPALKVGGGKW